MAMTNTQTPKLRFPEFTSPWKTGVLGEIATFLKGRGISKADISEYGETPCIRYGELYTDYGTSIADTISYTDVSPSELHLSEGNEVIVPASGEDAKDIATAAVVLRDGVALGGDLNVIRSTQDGLFLASYLSGKKRLTLASMAQGHSVVHLYPTQLRTLELAFPTLSEQKKISTFLASVDAKIAHLEKKKTLLQDYKRGCMQQLFAQEIRFKADDGSEFPDWEEKHVDEVFRVTRGNVLAVSKMSQEPEGNSCFPVYSSQTKENGLIGYFNEYLYEDAITWTTDGANAGEVKFRKGKFYCTNVCGVLLSSEGYANNCISEMLNQVTRRFVSYVGNPKLMNNVMAKIKIEFPHPDEQRKIANFLSAIDKKIELGATELEKAKLFKKGLLQQMFI